MTISQEVMNALTRHSVIVNEGSGVLIQPASDEYSYVLTAEHVINGKTVEQIDITDTNDDKITVIALYPHASLDAAIIKIELQVNLPISAYSDCRNLPPKLKLRGFPGKHRAFNKSCIEQIESYNLNYINSTPTHWTYRNESHAPYEDVKGCSGGGIFYSKFYSELDEVFIAGVEYELTGENVRQGHDHIGCIPIDVFKDIIKERHLAELKPLYLMGFQYLYGSIFPPDYYQHILEFEHEKFVPLLNWIKAHCNRNLRDLNFTPQTILSEHGHQFVVNSRQSYEVH